MNFPPWLAIFDGLGTAGEASDSNGTTVQCLCEGVLSDGVSPQSKNGVEVELKRKYIEAGNLKFYRVLHCKAAQIYFFSITATGKF